MSVVIPAEAKFPLSDKAMKRMGSALIGRDGFFKSLVNVLPAAIYTTDVSGSITYFNEAAVELWGHRPELGKSEWCGSWKLYWPDGRPMMHHECPMAIAIREQRCIRGAEAIAERPDGSRVPFIPFPTPIFDDATEHLIGAVNLLVDISERKSSENALSRLASIIESSDDAIISKTLDGTITSWNKGAERTFGYLAEEIVGRPIKTLIPPERHSEEDAIIHRISSGQRVEHYETVRQRKDGSRIDVSLTISPIKDSFGRIIGASKISRDISARKKSDAQLALLAREAEHRTKNVLATVQAAVRLTRAGTVCEYKQLIEGRIQALANVHAIFVESRWTGASLQNLIAQELAPYLVNGKSRASVSGPDISLEPSTAQTVAVAIHELSTNAAKYGALSNEAGRLAIDWAQADGRITIRWSEMNGPTVSPPTHQGFGMRVVESMVRGMFNGDVRFDWRRSGLYCEIALDPANSLAR